ncbi:hypothetical protein evm_008669 [Chilo suppressalis]|nr:hypothetical protein evm_008669 [Chilo suppressalis]
MNLADSFKTYFVVFLILNLTKLNTNGLKVSNLQDDNIKDFVVNLYNVFKNLESQKHLLTTNKYQSFTDIKLDEGAKQESKENKLNKVFVKRLVPHNYETGLYEYDGLLKTLFKPLIRVDRNNKKIVLLDKNTILKANKLPKKLLKRTENFDIVERPLTESVKHEDSYLIQPFQADFNEKVTAKHIINDVKRYIRNNNAKKVRQLKYLLLNVLGKSRKPELRSIVYLPPGNHGNMSVKVHLEDVNHPDHKLKDGQPLYSFWNYWTYDKEIFQDNCKGNLVQWGNMCIQPMPH